MREQIRPALGDRARVPQDGSVFVLSRLVVKGAQRYPDVLPDILSQGRQPVFDDAEADRLGRTGFTFENSTALQRSAKNKQPNQRLQEFQHRDSVTIPPLNIAVDE
jgi:hypothetical protein